jgi:hypothetical protein
MPDDIVRGEMDEDKVPTAATIPDPPRNAGDARRYREGFACMRWVCSIAWANLQNREAICTWRSSWKPPMAFW